MYPNPYGGYMAQPAQGYAQQAVNPWQQRLAQMEQQAAPHYEIIRVNGEAGARTLRMGPNSSVIVMDETAPIVWLCQTDGAGYLTATPYRIELFQPEPQADVKSLEERLTRLEAMIGGQSDDGTAEPKRANRSKNAAE